MCVCVRVCVCVCVCVCVTFGQTILATVRRHLLTVPPTITLASLSYWNPPGMDNLL